MQQLRGSLTGLPHEVTALIERDAVPRFSELPGATEAIDPAANDSDVHART